MAIATATLRGPLRADAPDQRLRDRGRAPVQGGADRRLLPPLLRPGGRHRRRDARAGRRRPARHRLPLPRLRARARRRARGGHGRALRARRRLRARSRRLDAPARRRASATTAAGASSPGSCRSRPASHSPWSARSAGRPFSASSATAPINMGAWHESLNLAAVWRLPVVFLVMNNEYGMGTSVERASAVTELYRRAAAYDAAGRARRRRRPARRRAGLLDAARRRARASASRRVLELVTYRYRGHSVADAGLAYRTRGEIDEHIAPRPDLPRARAARSRRASPTPSSTRMLGDVPRSASRRRSRRRSRARAPRGLDARDAACTRRAARPSSRGCSPGAPVRRARARLRRRARASEHDRRPPPPRRRGRTGTATMTYREALRLALREEMLRDERVFVMGEEVGVFEGAYKVTAGPARASSGPTACATRRSPRRASSARASARR